MRRYLIFTLSVILAIAAASCASPGPKCRSIAHFLGGQWQVVFAQGVWVGPEPWTYPEEYGLK